MGRASGRGENTGGAGAQPGGRGVWSPSPQRGGPPPPGDDPGSGEILVSELTTNEVGDLSMVGPLLDQIPGDIASVMADGAYDGEPVYRAIAERQPQLPPAVIIPPRATAVLSPTADTAPSGATNTFRSSRRKDAGVGRKR